MKAEEKKRALHYKLVSEETLYNYAKRFDWEERYYKTLHHEINELENPALDFTKSMYINNANNAIHLNNAVVKLQNLLIQLINDVDVTDRDSIKTLVDIGNLTKSLRQLQETCPVNINENYAMIKILHKTDSNSVDELEERIDELVVEGLSKEEN